MSSKHCPGTHGATKSGGVGAWFISVKELFDQKQVVPNENSLNSIRGVH